MDNQNNPLLPEDDDICVTLDFEDGSQKECEILTIFEAEGRDYIVLIPTDEDADDEEEGDIYIYRYHEDEEGNPSLEELQSDQEYELVEARFEELLDELDMEED
ncbi:MAG: DUF1292 domain-containing protein [Eubacterium sp.]|nr:DUF1292 domain-containing protein [Eubacterium sp.]